MNIQLKESIIIRPAQETPKHCLWNSDLDLVAPAVYVPGVQFYRRPNDSSNFFEGGLMKESLSNVLVPFYPVAGRLGQDEIGRIEIQCNGEGVLFMEAETNCVIDDLGDFSEGLKLLPLVPTVDDSKDKSSANPLLLIQVTHFKCGGVCLGHRMHHVLADAISAFHFFSSWAATIRGLPISIPPIFDRTMLSVGLPTSPAFHHIEYDPPPSMNTPAENIEFQPTPEAISTGIFKLSLDQINTLTEKCKKDHGSTGNYSRFEVIAAHIWRCTCKARGLSDDQATKLYSPTNGRSKLNPPIPSGYFGNVIFTTALVALSGDLQSEPLSHTAERIHKAFKQMDDKYFKSALAYLKQQHDPTILRRGAHTFKCPNLNIVNASQIPTSAVDFGWGRPVFGRNVNTYFEGISHINRSPTNDGSLLVLINLQAHHLQFFKKLFYDLFQQGTNVRSRY